MHIHMGNSGSEVWGRGGHAGGSWRRGKGQIGGGGGLVVMLWEWGCDWGGNRGGKHVLRGGGVTRDVGDKVWRGGGGI